LREWAVRRLVHGAERKFPIAVDLDLVIIVETALVSSSSSSSSCMLVETPTLSQK
jgi:hypothetical protein